MKKTPWVVFGETVVTGGRKSKLAGNFDKQDIHNRLMFFYFLLVGAFALTVFHLFNLTIIKGNYYRLLSQDNRVKEIIYPVSRGVIYDRNSQILVSNKPGYVADVDCGGRRCLRKISHEQALKQEISQNATPLTLEIVRQYADNFAFSHILGFTGSVKPDELGKAYCGRILSFEDELGRAGIEKTYDCALTGKFGKKLIEVDALGNEVKVISQVEGSPGKNIILALDKDLQIRASTLMQGKKGTVIAHDPKNGEILALYSSPSFDLSQFAEGFLQEDYQKLVSDQDLPLFNRGMSGQYPPGSTIKPMIAAAALEEKVVSADYTIEDTGFIEAGGIKFNNWYFTQYGKTEGAVNLEKAIMRSNDIYFYKVGQMLGPDKISKWLKKFNLGSTLGIELDGEEKGTVPDRAWLTTTLHKNWYLGDTFNISIGQGNLLTTPLQIAFANGAFANHGIICKPMLTKSDKCQRLTTPLISKTNHEIIVEAMRKACSEGGTGFPLFNFKVNEKEISVACKTGTSEYGDKDGKTHAWFFAFAPVDNPKIAVTVLVEGGGEGSSAAGPIAKEILASYFQE